MKTGLIFVLVMLVLATSLVQADDDPETPWPIEERCAPAPTQPPAGWMLEGMLLMSGYGGIHAIQANWETPRIVASFYASRLGIPINGGQLSPDGRWYAVPIGEIFTEISYNQYWFTEGLRVYSTFDDTELNFELREYNRLLDYGRGYGAWTYEVVRWIDNDTLLIGPFMVRPFEQSVQVSSLVSIAGGWDFDVAPDWTRIYGFTSTSFGFAQAIFDAEVPDEVINLVQADGIAWKPDSFGFIGKQRVDTTEQLALFTRDGEFIEQLFVSEGGRLNIRRPVSGRNDLGWSPDGLHFAFIHQPPYPETAQLMLLDLDNRVVVNTCLGSVSHPVWSPNGAQIAMLLTARENLRVVILDTERWVTYDVARHSGISGALQPDMIAWRSDD